MGGGGGGGCWRGGGEGEGEGGGGLSSVSSLHIMHKLEKDNLESNKTPLSNLFRFKPRQGSSG